MAQHVSNSKTRPALKLSVKGGDHVPVEYSVLYRI